MAKKIEFRTAIMCEHVVQGANGKQTLVNVTSGDLIVSSFPANIWVAFYLEIRRDDALPDHMEIELNLGGKKIAALNGSLDFSGSNTNVIAIPSGLMAVEEPCTFKLIGRAKGFHTTTILQCELLKAVDPPEQN